MRLARVYVPMCRLGKKKEKAECLERKLHCYYFWEREIDGELCLMKVWIGFEKDQSRLLCLACTHHSVTASPIHLPTRIWSYEGNEGILKPGDESIHSIPGSGVARALSPRYCLSSTPPTQQEWTDTSNCRASGCRFLWIIFWTSLL